MAELTHYEALDVSREAAAEDLLKAYQHWLGVYDEAGVATYSLLDAEQRRTARKRIEEAYRVLSDPALRAAYDEEMAQRRAASGAVDAAGRPHPVKLPDPVTGADLRRFRESRGVTLSRIAADSKVGKRTFEDIEGDRFERLPAVVYVRGFLREYARAVGLDPVATAESFVARLPRR
jgi:flagellar biosynthesis protein FlhG